MSPTLEWMWGLYVPATAIAAVLLRRTVYRQPDVTVRHKRGLKLSIVGSWAFAGSCLLLFTLDWFSNQYAPPTWLDNGLVFGWMALFLSSLLTACVGLRLVMLEEIQQDRRRHSAELKATSSPEEPWPWREEVWD